MSEIYEFFEDFDSDVLCVEGFDIHYKGVLITHIAKSGRKISLWSGDPENDKHAEEIIPSPSRKSQIIKEICELF